MMLIAPYMSMINGQLPLTTNDGQAMQIDITKIEEAIEKGRGYYDFIADYDGKEIVLRFNRVAFRKPEIFRKCNLLIMAFMLDV